MFETFGNKVMIKSSPETIDKGLAGKIGKIFGETTPSMMDFEIIGELKEDYALGVYFEDIKQQIWFSEDLIELLDNGSGTEISLNGIDKKWIKDPNGKWVTIITKPSAKKK
jgi:hypothetical protein